MLATFSSAHSAAGRLSFRSCKGLALRRRLDGRSRRAARFLEWCTAGKTEEGQIRLSEESGNVRSSFGVVWFG